MQCNGELFICVTEAGPEYFQVEVVDDLWHVFEYACCSASKLKELIEKLNRKWGIKCV